MDPTHQDFNKQLPQAPMPGGFQNTSQPGYNPALNPSTDPTRQQGDLYQGEHQQGGLHRNGLDQGGYQQGGLQQGGLDRGGYQQSGLQQGGLDQGGLHQGGLHQGDLHQGGLRQDNLNQDNLHQNDINQRGLHAHNPRNTDIGLSHDQQIGTNHQGTHVPHAHHTHQGAAVLPSTNYRNNDDLSEPSSTAATHGSVDSRRDLENPSTAKGIKDTLAGNLQMIAGVVTGNEGRRVRGETKAQEGKMVLNAAKTQQTGRNVETIHGHGRGDLQGTHLHDVKGLEQPAGGGAYGVGTVPPPGHGRGGLENKEVGNDAVFANANTGKATGAGYGRGGLEGMASREE